VKATDHRQRRESYQGGDYTRQRGCGGSVAVLSASIAPHWPLPHSGAIA